MSSEEMIRSAGTRRRRGRPSKISRDRIVSAARSLAPDTLTMQAVADELGVDRKALNYYVSDRQGLLELVALDVFESAIRGVDTPESQDWRQVLRSCARAMKEALTAAGVLIVYIRFDGMTDLGALATVERIMERLVRAGFDAEEAGRVITLLAVIAHAAAREDIAAASGAADPQVDNVVRTVEAGSTGDLPLLHRFALSREAQSRAVEQFEFELDLIVDGLDRRLEERAR
ncbi:MULTISPECIES: TetR/AcrR family transcriptional regulator C-terminal domain-containing protein [unclassified Rhodococcus (in: high G+C Gram-positive bacteria)]|uniref:TetR/AcrR family transcriptional regulator C-terminal domain-containing protein n=1 Tax=Rhodococcus sp. SJ-3 TaxID=3454628 RepID=UPI002DB4016A|nr:TetR/AcrR family transcriptional regulator C-terminal domain-containing protein [Rhodococcus sp. (in: high G+C Gram-positive bacteria)]